MKSSFHRQILHEIKKHSGKPTRHTFLKKYLGNDHPTYAISSPVVRMIARDWMKNHRDASVKDFTTLLTDLIQGESFTEKYMAGIFLDYATAGLRKFSPSLFDKWLNSLEGWAEVDALCTNNYSRFGLTDQWDKWKPLLTKFSKSKNINKRRAALVLFCAPLGKTRNDELAAYALTLVDRLKGEKDGLITKAISWVLRSMVKYNREILEGYLKENAETLPKIALRETRTKLETGRKTRKGP